MTELIQIDLVREHVAVVTLNRPPVNAMGREIREQFVDAMDRLGERDDVRVIILTSGCKVFSAGADIKEKRDLVAAPGGVCEGQPADPRFVSRSERKPEAGDRGRQRPGAAALVSSRWPAATSFSPPRTPGSRCRRSMSGSAAARPSCRT